MWWSKSTHSYFQTEAKRSREEDGENGNKKPRKPRIPQSIQDMILMDYTAPIQMTSETLWGGNSVHTSYNDKVIFMSRRSTGMVAFAETGFSAWITLEGAKDTSKSLIHGNLLVTVRHSSVNYRFWDLSDPNDVKYLGEINRYNQVRNSDTWNILPHTENRIIVVYTEDQSTFTIERIDTKTRTILNTTEIKCQEISDAKVYDDKLFLYDQNELIVFNAYDLSLFTKMKIKKRFEALTSIERIAKGMYSISRFNKWGDSFDTLVELAPSEGSPFFLSEQKVFENAKDLFPVRQLDDVIVKELSLDGTRILDNDETVKSIITDEEIFTDEEILNANFIYTNPEMTIAAYGIGPLKYKIMPFNKVVDLSADLIKKDTDKINASYIMGISTQGKIAFSTSIFHSDVFESKHYITLWDPATDTTKTKLEPEENVETYVNFGPDERVIWVFQPRGESVHINIGWDNKQAPNVNLSQKSFMYGRLVDRGHTYVFFNDESKTLYHLEFGSLLNSSDGKPPRLVNKVSLDGYGDDLTVSPDGNYITYKGADSGQYLLVNKRNRPLYKFPKYVDGPLFMSDGAKTIVSKNGYIFKPTQLRTNAET